MTAEQEEQPLTPKPVSASRVVMSELMLPTDANPTGNVHGGVIMKLVDTAAAVAAQKHCRRRVVTARIDSLNFLQPVYVGNLVTLKASVNAVGRTSMEIGVRVEAENLRTGEISHVASAYLVFVALDEAGQPTPVPPLIAETEEERRRMSEAKLRREHRLRGEEAVRALRSGSPRRRAMHLPPGRQALAIGHRGAAGHAPENTRASFERAIQFGVDFVEMDVHQTKDGQLVVIHDHALERTTNGRGLVHEKRLAELRELDAGAWYGVEFVGQRLPTLDEALQWVRGRTRVSIEIKHGPIYYAGIEEQVVALLEQHGMASDAIVISFDHASVRRIRELSDDIATGVLYAARPIDPVSLAIAAGADALLPNWSLLTRDDVDAAHRAGLAIVPWTINEPAVMRRVLALGVDGITTDYPDRLIPLVSRQDEAS